ncbi:hypothetical protein AA101099_2210 [Neoasaia chiangmaiensis NBRC 101099]|uniref:Uncharacterized protein n=1 Tax=Neoasaia chiangmaiensis TaxID=320497 RepID=A0A1U9KSU5_9PROT|nr:DUF3597 domain-containing protein [Neoasaia chiangmaiensis]AQS88832.1 hypothetical protein A0U93_13875 [Neoasaia chiangmaiensis]GBR40647.1 hypothetical protein AA101099_2210 [Neoasaia chiangmaiensis NBRC 101099]GEN13802.1 hypothetical protein NCH01_02330 [Neoasaia chiangmaiensis]
MSIFSTIMSKIFGHADATPKAAAPASEAPAPSQSAPAASPAAPAAPVDVNAVLSGLAATNGQNLNWRESIVDLLKLLDMDSSLPARKELANELHYTGSTDDTATMNVWLIKQVMQKLAENGGKVPDELKH